MTCDHDFRWTDEPKVGGGIACRKCGAPWEPSFRKRGMAVLLNQEYGATTLSPYERELTNCREAVAHKFKHEPVRFSMIDGRTLDHVGEGRLDLPEGMDF